MAKFIAPNPIILNGKLREIINLEKITSFTYMRSTPQHYGYLRFGFDKGHEHIWAYLDDAGMKADLKKIYNLLGLEWQDENF